jgi:hypothetical protein
MCDSYEARLMELLDTFTPSGSNESVAALQQGLKCNAFRRTTNLEMDCRLP